MSPSIQANSLPAMLYLLSIDIDKEKLPDRKKIGYVLRAAALVELGLLGKLVDVDGKVHVTTEVGTGDPVLDKVLGEIAWNRDRKWKQWVRHDGSETLHAVESQLVSGGAIEIHARTLLADKVHAVDSVAIAKLRQRVLTTLSGGQHIEKLDPYDLALTALAANGELGMAIPNKERKAHKDRISALTDHIGACAPALRQLVAELRWLRTQGGWIGAANAANAANGSN